MSDKDAATPRVYLIRHGETEWSRNGRYTGMTDLPLLPEGEDKVRQTARVVFGAGKLIDPSRLIKVYCSPRQRAQRTLELLLETTGASVSSRPSVEITENIREWTYADYEGLKTHEIVDLRKSRGHDADGHKWNIWVDGTEGEGSESAADVTKRLDLLIGEITEVHGEYLETIAKGGDVSRFEGKRDIVIVAHGHILRAFVKRWLGFDMGMELQLMLEPGGVCGLSYAHGKVNERAVLCGMSFPASV